MFALTNESVYLGLGAERFRSNLPPFPLSLASADRVDVDNHSERCGPGQEEKREEQEVHRSRFDSPATARGSMRVATGRRSSRSPR